MNEPLDVGLPYCPKCGECRLSAIRPEDGEPFDFGCIAARCLGCDCSVRIQMRPGGMQLIDDSLGETDVAYVGPGDGGLSSVFTSRLQRRPNRINWLVVCYAALLFAPYLLANQWGSDPRILWTFALHYSIASLLGLWAASGPWLSVERVLAAFLATIMLGEIVRWCLGGDLEMARMWFAPATGIALAAFVILGRFGWRIRKLPTSKSMPTAPSLQFSVLQLLIVTAAVSVTLVVAQQLAQVFRLGDAEFWAPIAMGLVTTVGFMVSVWAILGHGRMFPKILLTILTAQILSLAALYAISEWSGEALFIVSTWSLAYVVLVSVPLFVFRASGYRFTRVVHVRKPL